MPLGSAVRGLRPLRTGAPAPRQLGVLPIAWAILLMVLIAGPWLAGGYIFGTDSPGQRRFDFPSTITSSYWPQVVLAVVYRVVGGEATGKLFVLAILFVAALTAYEAAPVDGFIPRAAAAGLYVMNPFVYGRLHYGQLFVLAGYAVLPWVTLRLRRLLLEPGVAAAVVSAVSMVLLGILSLHLFLVALVLAGALLLTHTVAAKDRFAYLRKSAPGLLIAAGLTIAASSYWLIPILIGRGPAASVIAGIGPGDLAAYAAVPDQQLGLLPNLLGLYGFWAENAGRFTSMKAFVPAWPVVLALLLVLGAVGAISVFRKRRDPLAPWVAGLLIAALIALILEAGVSHPLTTGLVTWLDANLPLYRGMRDAGKWAALLALVYSQLIALGVAAILRWLREQKRAPANAEWLVAVASGLLVALPIYYGNGLLYGMHGEIAPSQYPAGWYAADQALAADGHPDRALFLPWHEYMALSFVRNQNSVVASPAPSFFSIPVLASTDPEVAGVAPPSDPDQAAISDLVAAGSQGQWSQVLAAHKIKYVLLAREVDWSSYGYLDSQPALVRVGDYGTIVLYRNSLVH
jgi:hypothetical protein